MPPDDPVEHTNLSETVQPESGKSRTGKAMWRNVFHFDLDIMRPIVLVYKHAATTTSRPPGASTPSHNPARRAKLESPTQETRSKEGQEPAEGSRQGSSS